MSVEVKLSFKEDDVFLVVDSILLLLHSAHHITSLQITSYHIVSLFVLVSSYIYIFFVSDYAC